MNAGQKADAAAVLERARRRAIARAEAAETALREAEEVLRAVQRNDMTRRYEYRGRNARRADGSTPADGSRWQTPRELATTALKRARTTSTEGERDG
jgi:hypothetical protein